MRVLRHGNMLRGCTRHRLAEVANDASGADKVRGIFQLPRPERRSDQGQTDCGGRGES
jgi:hypothetical protein